MIGPLHLAHGLLARGVVQRQCENSSTRERRIDVLPKQATLLELREALLEHVLMDPVQPRDPEPAGMVLADDLGIQRRY